jgi:hypothetical protein
MALALVGCGIQSYRQTSNTNASRNMRAILKTTIAALALIGAAAMTAPASAHGPWSGSVGFGVPYGYGPAHWPTYGFYGYRPYWPRWGYSYGFYGHPYGFYGYRPYAYGPYWRRYGFYGHPYGFYGRPYHYGFYGRPFYRHYGFYGRGFGRPFAFHGRGFGGRAFGSRGFHR